jgi:hypothetical protein
MVGIGYPDYIPYDFDTFNSIFVFEDVPKLSVHLPDASKKGIGMEFPVAQRLGQPRHCKTSYFLGKSG